MTIAIVDYGLGNLYSVTKALEHITSERVTITSEKQTLLNASRVVLPGQGAIRDCISELKRTELMELIISLLRNANKPLLGICVGEQLLMHSSDENCCVRCLSYIPGKVIRFSTNMCDDSGEHIQVPHMGWNKMSRVKDHPIFAGIAKEEWFYFAHSFYVAAERNVFGIASYGDVNAHVAIGCDATFGVQFHPEKSASSGMRILSNFVSWSP